MLKLKLQYFGHLMWRLDSLEETLMLVGMGAGGKGDDRGWDGWMASPTRWMWVWVNSRSWWWTGRPGVLQFMFAKSRTRLSLWTELNWEFAQTNVHWVGDAIQPSYLLSPPSLALIFLSIMVFSNELTFSIWTVLRMFSEKEVSKLIFPIFYSQKSLIFGLLPKNMVSKCSHWVGVFNSGG